MGSRKLEKVTSINKMQIGIQGWFGPGLGNTLITSCLIGTDEIYALDWEAP
ncbi:MAG: hypothetical protein WBW33_17595 [Bryobacteraceae bacterium]